MTSLSFQDTGFDKLIQEFSKIKSQIPKATRDVLLFQIDKAVGLLSTYPAETPGNQPPPPYWQRDYGMVGAGGQLIVPSEHYTKSWDISDYSGSDSVSIKASNDVSYAPWVVGTRQQSRIHERNGWPKVREILNQVGLEGADEFVNGEITPPDVLIDRLNSLQNEINSIAD